MLNLNRTVTPNPALGQLEPYAVVAHGAPIDLKLDGNEGVAPSDDLLTALCQSSTELLRCYPDARELQRLAAEHFGLPADQVLVTGGVDDALDRACRALLGPDRTLVMPVPTFEMLPRYAQLSGAQLIAVPWPSGPYPVDQVLEAVDATTAAIAVVSPNNPTGAVACATDLARLAAAAPHAALLVDLAYGEFADEDLTQAALSLPSAIVFRTLSKAWGLAGLRVGFALGPPRLLEWLAAAGNPYAVSGPSLALAARRLNDGSDDVETYVGIVRCERQALLDLMAELKIACWPSQANFVLCAPQRPAWLRDGLAGLGIAVRGWPASDEQRSGMVRISCPGSEAGLARLQRGIRAVERPDALLLDMDGVLADVSGSYRRAIIETAASYGIVVSESDVARAKTRGNVNNDWLLTRQLLAERGCKIDLPEVRQRFEALYQGEDGRAGLFESERLLCPRATLEQLAARLPLGIVTGRPRSDAQRFLDRCGISTLFSCVVCMEDAAAKPSAEPVRLALQKLGAHSGWMVGDTPDDLRAARTAGVVPLGIRFADSDIDALVSAGAARVLSSLEQLKELLP